MIVVASTRPGRVGPSVARWFKGRAEQHGAFELDVVDLAELGLPFLDEPNHPRLRKYVQQHTWDWSARVTAAAAFVFVMPEYNHGINAPLKNALDFLYVEWAYKPVGFVSYGGIAGGARAAEMAREVAAALRMMALLEAVHVTFVGRRLDEAGEFRGDASLETAAAGMLDALVRVEAALRPLRAPAGG